MSDQTAPIESLIHELKERAKELNCLYEIQELLVAPDATLKEICQGIVKALPPGWQYPDVCEARVELLGELCQTSSYHDTPWIQSAKVIVQGEVVGEIRVCYTEERPLSDEGPFLKEERKLIDTISEQVGFYILHQRLRQVFQERLKFEGERKGEWWIILDLLKRTDPGLLMRISSKMINYLCWNGVKEAERLLDYFGPAQRERRDIYDPNSPFQEQPASDTLAVSDDVFALASRYIPQNVILDNIQRWIKEDRSSFLVDTLVNPGSSLTEISLAIERFHLLSPHGIELTKPREKWFRTALIRRVLSDQPDFVRVAKNYIDFNDFSNFMRRVVCPTGSHGKLGGKSSGLFLAEQILKQSPIERDLLENLRTPKTWYLTSDTIFYFIGHNNLEDFIEQKYKDIGQVKQEYPYIVHTFKNSPLPPEIVKGLSLALDDFGDVPLIVRSSSLLEDQTGAAFAGKYKSLFIANRGTKEERLEALSGAVTEVFASLFGPDPIEYRFQMGLLDSHEEMGVMIQEVVGRSVGRYYMPAFAGVAFSKNEFRWSSRIRREDGLVRLVPGLGTRAVDRLSDEYPVLISPGQPGLRVNVTLDEIVRYSPSKIDLINLETRAFETVEIRTLLKELGDDYPLVNQIVSILQPDRIRMPGGLGVDFEHDEFIVTFEGLIARTPFIHQVQTVLKVLQEALGHAVDIEFAHDGENFYLLQCRSQSYGEDDSPAELPNGDTSKNILFVANRYIPNGIALDINYIVYVDPLKYAELSNLQDLVEVGQAVSRLNQILPRRQFILMGPGRWGSRGDIKLGVNVTYSDINNTAMLVEIARKQRDYVPDPSFGTHFFQDLVEASIRYLPLYPDDRGAFFNEAFLTGHPNLLSDILPDFAHLSEVLYVIDVPAVTDGLSLQVLMNADKERAVALLTQPSGVKEMDLRSVRAPISRSSAEAHWRWRLQAAEAIAAQLDPERFNVAAIYVFGSANNATAGPESDIDLLIHFRGNETQRQDLLSWLEGWSLCLSQVNTMRTGYKTPGLLDVHLVSDEEIEKRTGFASRIGAISDAARPLAMDSGRRREGSN
jgi:pyruvate,water dikinase